MRRLSLTFLKRKNSIFTPDRRTLLLVFLLVTGVSGLWYLAHPTRPMVREHPRLSWKAHPGSVNCLAFSPDGKRLASGCCIEVVKFWDPVTGEKEASLPYEAFRISFALHGQTLAIGTTKRIVLWDVGKRQVESTLDIHNGPVWSLAFCPQGKILASGGASANLVLWDMANNAPTILGSSSVRNSIAFSPEGKTLAYGGSDDLSGSDDLVRLLKIETGEEKTFAGHENEIKSVAFSPNGPTLISASQDGVVRIWNVETGNSKVIYRSKYEIWSTALSPDGRTLALSVSDKHRVELVDVTTGKVRAILTGGSDFIDSLAFFPDGLTLVTGSVEGTISLWDVPP